MAWYTPRVASSGNVYLALEAAVGVGLEASVKTSSPLGLWISTVKDCPANCDVSSLSYWACRTQNLNCTSWSGRYTGRSVMPYVLVSLYSAS